MTSAYNFACLDEQAKRMVRRALLKAVAVPGHQVPIPEPLRFQESRESETRKMHALEEYGLMHVKLDEDIARYSHIATTYAYPVKVEDCYVRTPSPIPKFDNPKVGNSAARQLFGAGREQRICAVPPYTRVVSLDFDDRPFDPGHWDEDCALCGASDTYLDAVITDDAGGRMFVCSDTAHCRARRRAGHVGAMGAPYEEEGA
jgi:alpha-D-ribose 1-methylphosphonate 5-phosphate C-P lyase